MFAQECATRIPEWYETWPGAIGGSVVAICVLIGLLGYFWLLTHAADD